MNKVLSRLTAAIAAGALLLSATLHAQNTSPFWSLDGNNNADNASKLGTTNAIPLRLFTNNQPRAFISTGGNFGIGTVTPQQRFHVEAPTLLSIFVSTSPLSNISGSGMIGYTKFLPTASGQRLGYFLLGSRGEAENNYNAAGMVGYAGGSWTAGSSHPAYLAFETTPSGSASRVERLRIDPLGNVGIGTTAPERQLHVFNGSAGAISSNPNAPLVVENSTAAYINILAPQANETGILFGNTGSSEDGGIIYVNGSDAMQFRTNGNVNRMTLSSTGDLDIAGGSLSFGSVEELSDAGGFTIGSNSNFVSAVDGQNALGSSTLRWSEVWAVDGTINTSDAREKTNIKDLNYGLKEIMQLRSTRFNWKSKKDEGDKIGLIAQELKAVLPEVVRDWEYKKDEQSGTVSKVPSARLGVAYSDIIPVLIKGMQEQQAQIEALKEEVAKLIKGEVTNTSLSSAAIGLASPNPVRGSTSISYRIPDGASNARLVVTDNLGRVVRTLQLSGSGTLKVDAATLSSGVYNYSLIIGNKTISTQKLTVVR